MNTIQYNSGHPEILKIISIFEIQNDFLFQHLLKMLVHSFFYFSYYLQFALLLIRKPLNETPVSNETKEDN